jgi:hypothetical protein
MKKEAIPNRYFDAENLAAILDPAQWTLLGKVFCLEAGRCASYGGDVGSGWKHVTAVRRQSRLEVYLDGRLSATSSAFDPGDFDLTIDRPLRIGFGQTDFFHGRMRDVRLYKGALTDSEIRRLSVPRME